MIIWSHRVKVLSERKSHGGVIFPQNLSSLFPVPLTPSLPVFPLFPQLPVASLPVPPPPPLQPSLLKTCLFGAMKEPFFTSALL